ncbi:peptidase P60, partial [Bacillus pseudomycoides]
MRKSITLLFSCLLVFSSISVANAEEVKSNQAYVDVAAATLWT